MKNLVKSLTMPGEGRLLSLDALQGLNMFWITGGCWMIASLSKLAGVGWLETQAKQTRHVTREGLHFYDLIFQLFMFISGIAIPLSVKSKLIRNGSEKDYPGII